MLLVSGSMNFDHFGEEDFDEEEALTPPNSMVGPLVEFEQLKQELEHERKRMEAWKAMAIRRGKKIAAQVQIVRKLREEKKELQQRVAVLSTAWGPR